MQQLIYTSPDELEWREAPDAAADLRPGGARAAGGGRHLRPRRADRRRRIAVPGPRSRSATSASPRSSSSATRSARVVARPARQRALPDLLRRVRALPARAHRQLRERAVHVDLRLRAGRGALGRLPRRPRRASPIADHMLVPVPDGLEPAAVASASDNISDAWRAVGPAAGRGPRRGRARRRRRRRRARSACTPPDSPSRSGAASVLYVDADAVRREIAEALGAETLAEKPKRLGPFPITVDASGDPDGLALALRSTAPDGDLHEHRDLLRRAAARCRCSRCTRRASRSDRPRATRARRCPTCSRWRPRARCTPSSSPPGWCRGMRRPHALLEDGWTKLVIERPSGGGETGGN